MAAKKKKPNEKDTGISGSTRSMRDEAEKEIARSPKSSPELAGQTPEELIHELRVHQIELEMQAEELRMAHLALEESRDKYLDLYEFAPIGYLTLTDKGIITNANLTSATLLGVARSTLLRAPLSKFIAEKDADQWHRYFVNVREQGEKQTCTLTLKRGDGSVFPARLESIRLSGKSDRTTIVRVVISDMTEIFRAEEAIRETSAWLRFALHSAKAGIWDWDFPTGKLVWSPEFFLLFGLPPDAPPSFETWLAVLHPDDRTSAMEKINQSIKEHRDLWNEYRILLPDGGWRWIGAAGSTSYNDSGEPLRMSGVCIDISKRKRAEKLLHDVIAKNPMSIQIVDKEGFTLNVNSAHTRLFGSVPPSDFSIFNDSQLIQSGFGELIERIKNGEVVTIPDTYYNAHDSVPESPDVPVWVRTVVFPLPDNYGKPEQFVFMHENITERKAAEEALRESEEIFRELFNNANDAIFLHEMTPEGPGKYILVNDLAIKSLGYTREEFLTMSPRDIVPKAVFAGLLPFTMPMTSKEGVATFESIHIRKDGSEYPVEVSTHTFPFKGRNVSLSIVRDITERKQAEDETKRSFERFKTVMDGLDALVYVVDMKTYDLLFLNKYGKDIWGEIEGQTCWKTIQSGQSGPCPFCTNDKLVDSNGNPTGVYHWEFQNTMTRKWYDCRDSAIRWLDGHLVRLEIATDITDSKQAADTIALTARKLALMNDVTYQFIQNKVTALRGFAELSKDVKTKAERLSFIEKEEHVLADIHRLIKDTREYQDIGLLQPQWIPVEQSIRIAVSCVSPKPGILIESKLPGLELYSDPLIEKIFINLIENAVLHGKTTRHITFSCMETTEGLILICEDDGVGISPKDKARLFDRLVGEKIRFGLFFVHECLLLSGMTIAETGEPGKGARFEITVPKGMWRMNPDTGNGHGGET